MHSFFTACFFLAIVKTVHAGAGWSYYDGPLTPDKWYTEYENCGGQMQSPINIETNRVLYDSGMEYFDLSEYSDCDQCSMELENVKGHTAEVKYSGHKLKIRRGSLPDEYVLDQFHFHWGSSDDRGSEHQLDNKRSPMEMHIVHHRKDLGNRTNSAEYPYGLAVLGYFFKIGRHNNGFDHLLSYFKNITYSDDDVDIEPFPLSQLLPENALASDGNATYYRYYGSLTTPPCYETVIWTIFTDKIEISQEQLDVFRTLRATGYNETTPKPISDDYRPVQPLHKRAVRSNDKNVLEGKIDNLADDLANKLRDQLNELRKACSSTNSAAPTSFVAPYISIIFALLWLAV